MMKKEREIKLGKDEWKMLFYKAFAWFGASTTFTSLIILAKNLIYGHAHLGWIEGVTTVLIATALTEWLEKDVHVLTDQAFELAADELSDEIYEKALEKYRQQFKNQKVNEDAN